MRYVRETGLFSKEAIKRKFSAIETKFEVQQGEISAIISETDLEELRNGDTTLFNRLASAKLDIEQLDLRFSRQQSEFSAAQGEITTLQVQSATYKAGIDGLTASLSKLDKRLTSDYSTTTEMEAEIQANINTVSSRITALQTEVAENYATTNYVNSQITQTADGITQSVSATYATKTYAASAASTAESNAKTAAQSYAASAEASAKTAAQGYANTAKSEAQNAARGYASAAEANAKEAAQGYASDAESNAKRSANAYTDEKLVAYSTTAQVESKIAQSADNINQTITANYATKTYVATAASAAETNAKTAARDYAFTAETNAKSAAQGYADAAESNAKEAAQDYADAAQSGATSAANGYTDDRLKLYSTTTQMRSAIDQKADSITQSVSSTYARITAVTDVRQDLDALGQDTVRQVRVEYAQSDNPVVAPTTGWSAESPDWEDGMFIWQRVATLKNGEWSYSNVTCVTGATGHGSYAHVKYSNDGGETFTSNNGDDVGDWMGIYVDSNEEAAVSGKVGLITPNNRRILLFGKRLAVDHSMTDRYTWVLVKGAQGIPGIDGATGVGIVDSIMEYYLSTSNIGLAGGEWSTAMQPYVAGRYYWTRLKTTYSDGTIKYSEPEIYDIYNGLYNKIIDLEEWSEISKRTQTKDTISDLVESSQTFMQVANRAEFFAQDHAPTSPRTGDTWIDTSDGNIIKRYDGKNWVSVRDAGTTDLIRVIGAPDDYEEMSLVQRISSAEQKLTDDSIVSVVQKADVFVSDDEARTISVTQARSEIAQWYDALDISVDKVNIQSSEVGFGLNLAVANEHSEKSVEIAKLPPSPDSNMKRFSISSGYLIANVGYTCITGLKWNRFAEGESFWLSFRGKRSSSAALTIAIRIAFFNTANAMVASCDAQFDLAVSEKSFEQVVKADSAAVDGASWYAIYAKVTGTGYASIRQMRIYQQSSSVIIADGAITANKLTANSVTTDKLAANAVTTQKLATDAIKSLNYSQASGVADVGEYYSTAGTYLDLAKGFIRSKNFAIDANGAAYLKGTITATGGKIANLTITGDALYSGEKNSFASTAPGIWIGPDGSTSIGGLVDGTNNYLRYDVSTGKMQLALDSLTVAGKPMAAQDSVDNALKLIQDAQKAADDAQKTADDANDGLITIEQAVDDATILAQSASSKADSASGTANGAVASANRALSTADTASSNAASALSEASRATETAATAQTTAQGAVTIADNAATVAGDAKGVADQASANAQKAMQDAASASTSASEARRVATDFISYSASNGLILGNLNAGTLGYHLQLAPNEIDFRYAGTLLTSIKPDSYNIYNSGVLAMSAKKDGLHIYAPSSSEFDKGGNFEVCTFTSSGINASKGSIANAHFDASKGLRTVVASSSYPRVVQIGTSSAAISVGNGSASAWDEDQTVNTAYAYVDYSGNATVQTISAGQITSTNMLSSSDANSEYVVTIDSYGRLRKSGKTIVSLTPSTTGITYSNLCSYLDSDSTVRNKIASIASSSVTGGITYSNLCSYLDSDYTVRSKIASIASSSVTGGITYSNLCSYLDSDSTVRSKVGSIASSYASSAASSAVQDYANNELDADVSSLVRDSYSYTRSALITLIDSRASGSSVTKSDVLNWVKSDSGTSSGTVRSTVVNWISLSTTIMNKAGVWAFTETRYSDLNSARTKTFNQLIDARLEYWGLTAGMAD